MFTKLMKARQSIRYVITLLKLLWLKVKLNAINSLWKYINNFKKSLYQCVQTALTNVNVNIQVLNFHRIKSLNLDILKLMTLPTWGSAWFTVVFIIQRNNITSCCYLIIYQRINELLMTRQPVHFWLLLIQLTLSFLKIE